jgi:hypothetical protein
MHTMSLQTLSYGNSKSTSFYVEVQCHDERWRQTARDEGDTPERPRKGSRPEAIGHQVKETGINRFGANYPHGH